MDDPQRRPAPEFEKARGAQEELRRTQEASLAPEQRRDYEQLRRGHDQALEQAQKDFEREKPARMAERMRTELAAPEAPAPAPTGPRHTLRPREKALMLESIGPYLAGRETDGTKRYGHQLSVAAGHARGSLEREHGKAMADLREGQQSERDAFLQRAGHEREREPKDLQKQMADAKFRESWERAVRQEAAREAEREQEIDRDGPNRTP